MGLNTKTMIHMNRFMQWMMATILICGLNVFSSCDALDNQDQPIESEDRLEFEAALSRTLDEASQDTRFEVGKEVLKTLTEIIANMNDEALNEMKNKVIETVLFNAGNVFFEDLSEEEYAVVHKCLVERFAMTEEDFSEIVGYMTVDANKVFGHMKVTFKDGQAEVGESDEFTIENIDENGGSTIMTMKFSDEDNGARIFVDRVADITPICVQFPEQAEVKLKMADGKELNGTLSLTSKSAFQYISFLDDEWHIAVPLASSFDGHHDNYEVYLNHSTNRTLDVNMDIIYDGTEKFHLVMKGDHDPKVNVDQLISLNSESTFADLLSVFEGGAVDQIYAVVYNEIAFRGKVNNVSDCLDAFANIQKLYGTNPDFSVVDGYTQRLNEDLDFTCSLAHRHKKATGSFVTCKESSGNGEYLPHVALQFPDEPAPMLIIDRMSDQDIANYRHLIAKIKSLGLEARGMLSVIREKVDVLKDMKLF